MTRRTWFVVVVAVLLIAALIVLNYLGLLGNAAMAEPLAGDWEHTAAGTHSELEALRPLVRVVG